MKSSDSSVRVSVEWKDQPYYAGDEIKCVITFTNASPSGPDGGREVEGQEQIGHRPSRASVSLSRRLSKGRSGHHRAATPPGSRRGSTAQDRPAGPGRSGSRRLAGPAAVERPAVIEGSSALSRDRSVSVISMEGLSGANAEHIELRQQHARQTSGGFDLHSGGGEQPRSAKSRQTSNASENSPRAHKASHAFPSIESRLPEFRFPPPSGDDERAAEAEEQNSIGADVNELRPETPAQASNIAARPRLGTQTSTHLFPGDSPSATARSSTDWVHFGQLSHGSVSSEYPNSPRGPFGAGQPGAAPAEPVSLLMGCVRLSGSFTVDESIVRTEQLEEAKEKGAMAGTSTGGIVGMARPKSSSGGFGFSWDGLNEGLSSLMRMKQPSSFGDMQDQASGAGFPILVTPQSLIFVDIQLAPGEKKSYEYKMKMPLTVPPSHRGRAIKIVYKLVVSVQQKQDREQTVQTAEFPFRVLGGVNESGELPVYELNNPFILLQDAGQISSLNPVQDMLNRMPTILERVSISHSQGFGKGDFLKYTEALLSQADQACSLPASPTKVARRGGFGNSEAEPAEATINRIFSNPAAFFSRGTQLFNISRDGKKVATVSLSRPSYRLGETILMSVSFRDAVIPCLWTEAFLESFESVEKELAVRSGSSVHKATRRTWASESEFTAFADVVSFSPSIPRLGTPEFATSGIQHRWVVRVRFVVPSSREAEEGVWQRLGMGALCEEKGQVSLVGPEQVGCDDFEVEVPVRVYGDWYAGDG